MFAKEFSLAVLGLVLGAMASLILPKEAWKRGLASSGEATPVGYEQMECLSEGSFALWAQKLHIPRLETPSCQDPIWGKVSRLIALSEKIRPTFPPEFAPSLQQDLRDPFWYLHKYSKRLAVDLSQTTSIAYNRPEAGGRSVFLGGMFLDDHPLDALSTIVHEARHSYPADPGHTVCSLGNIPRTRGGCDSELSLEREAAGAYSYGVAFQAGLALFGKNLADRDRERLALNALAELSTRFNVLPLSLAERFDLLAVLDGRGAVSWVHPFFSEPLPGPTSSQEGDPWRRIDFLVMNNGLLAFSEKGIVSALLPNRMPERGFAEWLKEPIQAWARVLVPFDDYSYNTFRFANGELKILRYLTDERQRRIVPFPDPLGDAFRAGFPSGHRFFTGLMDETYFIERDGRLALSRKVGGEPPWRYPSQLQSSSLWREGHGGVLSDQLFLVNQEGGVYRGGVIFEEGGLEYGQPEFDFSVTEADMPFVGPATKVVEGLHSRALLLKEGHIAMFGFDDEIQRKLSFSEPVVDMALARPHLSKSILIPAADRELAAHCGLRDFRVDPWTGGVLGLRENGNLGLAWKDPKGSLVCREENRWGSIKEFEILWPAETKDAAFKKRPLPRLQLRLASGKTLSLMPYERPK